MSHVSKYKGLVKDIAQFTKACEALGYTVEVGNHVVTQYGRNEINAMASVTLPGWRYAVAINTGGEVLYDHFGSTPNHNGVKTMDMLGSLMQSYNEGVVMDQAWSVAENVWTETLENGDRQIVLEY